MYHWIQTWFPNCLFLADENSLSEESLFRTDLPLVKKIIFHLLGSPLTVEHHNCAKQLLSLKRSTTSARFDWKLPGSAGFLAAFTGNLFFAYYLVSRKLSIGVYLNCFQCFPWAMPFTGYQGGSELHGATLQPTFGLNDYAMSWKLTLCTDKDLFKFYFVWVGIQEADL